MKKLAINLIVFLLIFCMGIFVIFLIFPRKYNSMISTYAKKYNISEYIVYSVINIESSFVESSESKVGAIGLMQILPSTAFEISEKLNLDINKNDLFNPEININIGCYYLRYLSDMFDGNIINILSSYNWGFSNVKNWIAKGNIDSDGTIKNIPIKETKDYIKKFKINSFVYEKLYNL